MKYTEVVITDHVILRRGLDILDGMLEKLEAGERIEIADVMSILKFLRAFGDERATAPEGSLRAILSEQSEWRSLVLAAEGALRSKRGIDFVRSSRRLSLVLRNQLNKEDAGLRQEDNRKEQNWLETGVNFARLESKYTRKPLGKPLNPGRDFSRMHATDSPAAGL